MTDTGTLWATRGSAQNSRLPEALEPGYILPFERDLTTDIAVLAETAKHIPFRSGGHAAARSWARLFGGERLVAAAMLLTHRSSAGADDRQTDLDPWLQRLGGTDDARLRNSLEAVKSDVGSLATRNGFGLLRGDLEREFSNRLESGDVDPAIGLLLAEIAILRDLKARLNRFPDERIDFFYRDWLGLTPKPAAPAHHVLIGTTTLAPVEVPKDCVLTSGDISAQVRWTTRIVPAEVQDIRRIRYHRKPSIVPISPLGFVTSATADQVPRNSTKPTRLFSADPTEAARLGIEVRSPVLALSEGAREICVQLEFSTLRGATLGKENNRRTTQEAYIAALIADPLIQSAFGFSNGQRDAKRIWTWVANLPHLDTETDPLNHVLAAFLANAKTKDQVRVILAKLASDTLLHSVNQWPNKGLRQILENSLKDNEMPPQEWGIADRPAADAFHLLLNDAFTAEASTADGLIEPARLHVSQNPYDAAAGLSFTLGFDPAQPSIAPLPGHSAPSVRLTLSPAARYSPISLFDATRLDRVDISVAVKGLKQLSAFGEDGTLDVSQTVFPFGVRPRDGAALLVGSPEMAAKRVETVAVHYTLSDLPPLPDDGSLDLHYAEYGSDFVAPDPSIDVSYLNADGWVPLLPEPIPLIRGARELSAARRAKTLHGTVASPTRPPKGGTTTSDFRQWQTVRSGFVRLSLRTDERSFGVDAYPIAMSDALRSGWMPFRKKAIPNPPLIPRMAEVSLDYTARSRIAVNAPTMAQSGEAVIQIGPFGQRSIFPDQSSLRPTLFPERLGDGTLYLGIGPNLEPGPISLMVEMEDSGHERQSIPRGQVKWHVLTKDGWLHLDDNRMTRDGTEGLRRSGVVMLDLPEGLDWQATELPDGLCWLAASANGRLDTFPALRDVRLNGIEAEIDVSDEVVPATVSFDANISGLASATLAQATQSGRPPETTPEFRTRVAEGLRHRQRAVTAWDIERLVLQAFPEVWKTKCFAARDGETGAPRAGHLLVVVIPHPPETADTIPKPRMFDSLLLDQIRDHIQASASPFAKIMVRNPSFERLQVRTDVIFDAGDSKGALNRRLSLDLSRRLSVWTAPAPLDGLGWSLNIEELGAYIEAQPYVAAVSHLELLHLVHRRAEERFSETDEYVLHDSAALGDAASRGTNRLIRQSELWSLPLAMPHHWILSGDRSNHAAPSRTIGTAGIGELAIGETLVVQKRIGQEP